MKQSTLSVAKNKTGKVGFAHLLVSVREADGRKCNVLVGYPGLPNVVREMMTGDAVLFETPSDGVIEVRVTTQDPFEVEFLASQISPRQGLIGGLLTDDPNNSVFSSSELDRIAESIEILKAELAVCDLFLPEQLDLITRKLNEIEAASHRLGRKDWINYVAGALTTMCISAAFAPEATSALFKSANAAFEWLFKNALVLLS